MGEFLRAEWRDLMVVNYEIEPELLKPFVPRGTEIDLWNGKALVSVVAFRFLDTRVLGMRVPFHTNFEEVNLRLYVKRVVSGECRRGVVFIKEFVPRRAIAAVARYLYNENYFAVPMRHSLEVDREHRGLHYQWRHGGREHSLSTRVKGEPLDLEQGSEVEFILEHYWGYSRSRAGHTVEYQVTHPRWRAWSANDLQVNIDFSSVYGASLAKAFARAHSSAFVAEGSPITVYKGVCLQP